MERNMRLLVDAHVFDGKFQGTRTYLQGIYQHMVHHTNIEFFFAARNVKNLICVFGKAANIHYISLYSVSNVKRLTYEFPKIIRELDIDYAHFQYITPFGKYCKEIVTIHDLLFLDYPQYFSIRYKLKNKYFFYRSAKRADLLLTVSDYSRQKIAKHFGIDIERIHVTPNAVLPLDQNIIYSDVKTKFGLDKYLMTVSRIEPRKNHLALLKAFVELKLNQKGYKLLFVGAPDLTYTDFNKYYKDLPNDIKACIIMSSVSFSELVELYRQASLFIFPSYAEGFGIPPLEAVEYGCPLLCSNTTAMSEFNLPEEWTFNPYDMDEMKRKMIFLLEHRPDLTEVKAKISKMFDWKKISDDLFQLIMSQN